MALKDIDSAVRVSFLKSMALAFPYLAILGYFIFGFVGIALAFPVSFVVGFCVQYFADNMSSSSVEFIYGSGKGSFPVRDRLAANLSQARYHKMRQKYDQALQVLDKALCQDPEFPEALLLKAQIHWEGFQEGEEAKKCLLILFRAVPDKNAPLNRWGKELYRTISLFSKNSSST